MCDPDFDYTLRIEYERISNMGLYSILRSFQHCSSYCYIDIELLADEVIFRMNQCDYSLRDKVNRDLVKLIFETFEMLKKISQYLYKEQNKRVGKKIVLIHTNFNKFMNENPSPVTSPVISPKAETPELNMRTSVVKVPKIMKKVKDMCK